MAIPASVQLNESICPVSDEFLGQLHRASPPDAVEIAKPLPEPQRARLAAFCYKRRHLHALGLMLASTCERDTLVAAAGAAGRTIYDQSRDAKKTLAIEMRPEARYEPKPISLVSVATIEE